MMSPRLADLRKKLSRAGLTPDETAELQSLESLAAVTDSTETRYRKVDTEKLRQRIAGREAAETAVELLRDQLKEKPREYARGFFDTIREFLGTVDPQAAPLQQPMTDAEAREFGEGRMGFGKHTGDLISEIPRRYLDWLCGEQSEFSARLNRYLRNEKVQQALYDELSDDDYRYE